MLNIHHIETENYVNGSGKRFVVWFQGCLFHCKGCFNPGTWTFENHFQYSIDSVFDLIQSVPDLDGVTFSGGEPFLQYRDLRKLMCKIKQETALSIQVFSGFEWDEIQSSKLKSLLDYIDILIFGRFDNTKSNNNQKLWKNPSSKDPWKFNNSDIEIDLENDGNLQVSGFPTQELLTILKEA